MITQRDVHRLVPPQVERDYYEEPDEHGFMTRKACGVRRYSDMKIEVGGEAVIGRLIEHFGSGKPIAFNFHAFSGQAFVVQVITESSDHAEAILRITGQVRIMGDKKMVKTKVLNRFYVASDKMMSQSEQGTINAGPQHRESEHIASRTSTGWSQARHQRWAKASLAQAIDHAREILEGDPARHEVAVVRIVKVVRRREMPIIVEDVK